MRALPFLLGVMGLLVTVAAHAAEIDCRYVTLSLPDDRSVVERPSTGQRRAVDSHIRQGGQNRIVPSAACVVASMKSAEHTELVPR